MTGFLGRGDARRPGGSCEAAGGYLSAERVFHFGRLVTLRFVAHGMTVYAAALAYRGLLALVPFALIVLSLIGLFGIENSLPRLTAALLRLRPGAPDGTVPLEGLLSLSAIVGMWSVAMGARVLMRALNAAHEIKEGRSPLARFALSVVFLPALAGVAVLAIVLLLTTTRIIGWIGGRVGMGPLLSFLGSWLRLPTALVLLGLAVSVVYRFGPSVRPPYRAVAAGAALTVVLWAATSAAFRFALSTVLDYGSTYGSLGAAVALLVYLHLSALVLLLGAEVSATVDGSHLQDVLKPRRGAY